MALPQVWWANEIIERLIATDIQLRSPPFTAAA